MLFHLGSAAAGRSMYRDQHIGAALEYAKGSINLLKPVIVGFNLNGAPTPLELPVWQATAALAFKVFGTWFGWANLVSLLFLFSALYPLFKVAERFGAAGCGWWAVLLFLAQPSVVIDAGAASPDGEALAAAVWFMFFASRLWEEPRFKWGLLTALAGALAAVSKLPFFMAAGLGCLFMTAAHYRRQWRVWVGLGAPALAIGAAFFAWTVYTERAYRAAELPLVDLRLGGSEAGSWYFGGLKYRLSLTAWAGGGYHMLVYQFGSWALAGVFLLGLGRPASRLGRWWVLGGVATCLLFFHLVFHHGHYWVMFAPAIALVCAPVAVAVEAALAALGPGRLAAGRCVLAGALALSTVQGCLGMNCAMNFDSYPYEMANVIRRHTSPGDKLLIEGGGWGGKLLILSNRKGLSVWDTRLLEDQQTRARLRALGFTKLVMVSETPMLTAIRRSRNPNPVPRQTYRPAMTPVVANWPTVIQNEDILIKDWPSPSSGAQ